jgi:hypothetical protein
VLKIVSDWRDISSHYILYRNTQGKRALAGFQNNAITNLESVVQMTDDDELIRCVTPNEEEDFMLLNKKTGLVRTFANKIRDPKLKKAAK